jgi:hypothetical protein
MRRSSFLALAGVLLAANMASADEARISINEVSRQRAPVALLEADGSARVIWENAKLGILSRVVPARDPASASTGEAVLLENTHLASVPGEGIVVTNRQPIALSDGDGGFWLIWIRQRDYLKVVPFFERREILSQEIRKRHFNRNGEPLGAEGIVAWAVGKTKSQATAALTPDGGFVVAWTSDDADETTLAREGVFLRWFDRSGTSLGPSRRVSAVEDTSLASWPSLSVGTTGRLLVLWHAPDGSSTGIFGRLFDENRDPIDEPVRINLNPSGEQKRPAAVAVDEGGWLVVWQSPRPGRSKSRVFLHTLDALGHPVGAEREISSGRRAHDVGPAIARTPRGSFFATWVEWDPSFPREIRGVELAANGQFAGEELQLNRAPINTQYRANLFGSEATGLFAIWEGFLQQRDGINGRPLEFLEQASSADGRFGRPVRPR